MSTPSKPSTRRSTEEAIWRTRRAAAGRCQCTGQCGGNHQFEKGQPRARCRAPHGCSIVRKKDNRSFWMLAATPEVPLAFPEPYQTDKPETVELVPWKSPDADEGDGLAFCQRCSAGAASALKRSAAKR